MKKIFEAYMNIDFNYHKENNLSIGKTINKRFTLTKNISPSFYALIQNLYNEYTAKMSYEYLTIKTFQSVVQSELKAGEKVVLNPAKMEQRI
jgi:hypothetical protein